MNLKHWMQSFRSNIMAISIGLVYTWFGILKFFPGLSPAETLAKNTLELLTFGLIPAKVNLILLAIIEVSIGLLFLSGKVTRFLLVLAIIHMICTFSPLFFFPSDSFTNPPFFPTLLGQYIGKNIIIIAALLTLKQQAKNSAQELSQS